MCKNSLLSNRALHMDLIIFLITLFIGIILVIIGIVLIILSMFSSTREHEETRADYGGVLIIGPLPIVFGSRNRAATTALVLAIVLTILSIFLFILTTRGL